MFKNILEALHLVENGRFDWLRAALVGIPVVLFLLWRIFTLGVYDSEHIVTALKNELIEDYQQAVYKQHGLYDDAPGRLERPSALLEELQDIEVNLSNLDMAAPLLSWSANEDVIVRFDYVLRAGGLVRERQQDVYKWVQRRGSSIIRDSSAFSYYSKFLF